MHKYRLSKDHLSTNTYICKYHLQQRARSPVQLGEVHCSCSCQCESNTRRCDAEQCHAAFAVVLEGLHPRMSVFTVGLSVDADIVLSSPC